VNAQNIIVSGAGTFEVNGTYIETGTYDGKPMYEKDGDPEWEIKWEWDRWCILRWEWDRYYYSDDDVSTPDLATNWEIDFGDYPAPILELEGPSLSYSSVVLIENMADVGNIETSVTITYNQYGGGSYTGTNGEDFVSTGKVSISNVPTGLYPKLERTSDATLVLSLKGRAPAHNNADDVSNFTVTFHNDAFTSGNASDVSNYNKSNLKVEFIQAHTVCASGCDFSTITTALSSSSVQDYDILDLAAESFTESIYIDKVITIIGKGADNTIIQAHVNYDAATERVITISPNLNYVKLYNLTVKNGKKTSGQWGGGIYLDEKSDLSIYNCIIKDNILSRTGTINLWGGGIYCKGNLYIENSLIYNNKTLSSGYHRGGGIDISSSSSLTIKNSTISGNIIENGDGAAVSAQYANSYTILNSTISGNSSTQTPSTVIYLNYLNATFKNTIIYANATSSVFILYNTPTINAYNCIMTSIVDINGDNVNNSTADPMLNSLADNGSYIPTYSLQSGSPAINNGLEDGDVLVSHRPSAPISNKI